MNFALNTKSTFQNARWLTRIVPLTQDDSVEKRERDRPGCSGRRPADWLGGKQRPTGWSRVDADIVFGATLKTAGETPALRNSIESFRQSEPAFTLIELLVVIAIIAILAGL